MTVLPGTTTLGEDVPLVRLRGLGKRFGSVEAVRPLDLAIHAGDFFAILGPSGCGKTTLLRMIGGFIAPSAGSVEIDGVDVTRLGPERRPANMVFQGFGLFLHMNVRQNVGYGLRIAKVERTELERQVDEVLRLVHMEEFAKRNIDQLSGGQQQRVALARALVMRPKVLLLDEPLGALDLKLRQAMQEELRRIHQQIGGTFVFVTHDQSEALGLANRIAVMQAGQIVQEGGTGGDLLQTANTVCGHLYRRSEPLRRASSRRRSAPRRGRAHSPTTAPTHQWSWSYVPRRWNLPPPLTTTLPCCRVTSRTSSSWVAMSAARSRSRAENESAPRSRIRGFAKDSRSETRCE